MLKLIFFSSSLKSTMLTGLQDGTMKIQCEREPGENAGSLKKDNNKVLQKAPESEDRKNESMEEMQ